MWSAKSTGHMAAAWPFVVAVHVDIFFLKQVNRTWECDKKQILMMIINAMQCRANGEINGWRKLKVKKNKEVGLWSESAEEWNERVYTSVVLLTIIWSRRNEGGKHGFSLTHYCTAGGDTAAQGEQRRWQVTWGGFFFPLPCPAWGGLCSISKRVMKYQRLDWSNFLISTPSIWGSRHWYFLYFLKLYWWHIQWLSCF